MYLKLQEIKVDNKVYYRGITPLNDFIDIEETTKLKEIIKKYNTNDILLKCNINDIKIKKGRFNKIKNYFIINKYKIIYYKNVTKFYNHYNFNNQDSKIYHKMKRETYNEDSNN